MEKMDPLFQNRGHTDFEKTDPFSVNFRMLMRTLYLLEWQDRDYIYDFFCLCGLLVSCKKNKKRRVCRGGSPKDPPLV